MNNTTKWFVLTAFALFFCEFALCQVKQQIKSGMKEKALFKAIKKHDVEAVALLIQQGADVNARRMYHFYGHSKLRTILSFAATENDTIVRMLLDAGANVNAKDQDSGTPLMYASSPSTISIFLKVGADVNASDENGFTALMFASMDKPTSTEKVEMLLKADANVNAKNWEGKTALSYATDTGVISLLLKLGADINMKDTVGYTALMEAIEFNRPELVAMLLNAGADVNLKNNDGYSALAIAEKNLKREEENRNISLIKNYKRVIILLKQRGAKE